MGRVGKGRKPKQPKTLLDIVDTEYPGFADEVMGMNVQQLEKKVAGYQKELEDSEEHKSNNDVLKTAKVQVSELEGPYKDVKKAIALKTRFLIKLIREKGGA